ncbi:MAG TPA: hypothetical protein DDZ51_14760 [Planctomycetaceae bacterium]|nr:hypothetical protein [Planctomycetaceae bacterium]
MRWLGHDQGQAKTDQSPQKEVSAQGCPQNHLHTQPDSIVLSLLLIDGYQLDAMQAASMSKQGAMCEKK